MIHALPADPRLKRDRFGLRLDRGRIDWTEVANLLELSYCLAAPKTLVKRLQSR